MAAISFGPDVSPEQQELLEPEAQALPGGWEVEVLANASGTLTVSVINRTRKVAALTTAGAPEVVLFLRKQGTELADV